MSGQPRGRACQPCHSIKIKCELGTHGGTPPCERCVRLGKDCTIVIPRRQKDRVAELEAKVAALTRLLESQGLHENSVADEPVRPSSSSGSEVIPPQAWARPDAQKKRKLESSAIDSSNGTSPSWGYGSSSESKVSPHGEDSLDGSVDRLLSQDVQQLVLDRYTSHLSRLYPAVPLSTTTRAFDLRQTHPVLLHAIMFAAGYAIMTEDQQEAIAMSFIATIASNVLTDGKKSPELLQALQIACLWYSSPKQHQHIATLFQFLHFSTGMALDLGYGGEPDPAPISASPGYVDVNTLEANRAWLVSFIMSASSMFHRRRPTDQRWTTHHDQCLQVLERSSGALPGDRLLGQLVRGESMFVTIMDRLNLAEQIETPMIGEPLSRFVTSELENLVRDWRNQVPLDLRHPSVNTYGFIADILIHEPVLHTATNKQSFAAPYLPQRVLIGGFAAPVVTLDHVKTLQALKTACHNILDAILSVPINDLIALPGFLFVPRMAYTLFILMKMHVAVTAPGNTYGQVLTPADVMLKAYLDRSWETGESARLIDARSGASRILEGVDMSRDWLKHYERTGCDKDLPTWGEMFQMSNDALPTSQAMQVAQKSNFNAAPRVGDAAFASIPGVTTNPDTVWDSWFDFDPDGADFALSDFFTSTDLEAWDSIGKYGNTT